MRYFVKGVLIVIVASLFGHGVGCFVAGPPKDPTQEILDKCAGEARAEYYVGGSSVEDSMTVYRECLRREGL